MSLPVPLKGFGGGGANLNFKVVGNPQPTSPRENTIWLNTDQKITSWIFSSTEPEAPEGGVVWFPVGNSSTMEFNALKKNVLQVYPSSAKQFVDGLWEIVPAATYQDGTWVEWWDGVLYDSGNQYEDYTGGWSANRSGDATVTFGNGNIRLTSSDGYPSGIYTNNALDISGFSKLCINCVVTSATDSDSNTLTIGVGDGANSSGFNAKTTVLTYGGVSEKIECDISAVDAGHVKVYIQYKYDMTISKIWLE